MNQMKEYAQMRKAQLKEQIAQMEYSPTLMIIQVGNVEASNRYIRNKIKDCEEVGIIAEHIIFPENITTKELADYIRIRQKWYNAVIVQQPLPNHINQQEINEIINFDKDVDGFHPMSKFKPATAKGIIDYLTWRNFNFEGADITIVGRSDIVGKPLAKLLTDKNCTVTLCHSKTHKNSLETHIIMSDLTICAVGKPKFLDCTYLVAPVIDVGINFDENGKMCGDCYGVPNDYSLVSPVPGGVGLLTRVALLENVVEAANGT